jgi:uncharacterized protein
VSLTSRRRLVLDTNVPVSALFVPGSVPELAFRTAFDCGILLASSDTLDELARVLQRRKFDAYLPARERGRFLSGLLDVSLLVVVGRVRLCCDPADDEFLELTLASAADLLVTGEADLLALASLRGTRILTPRQFGPSLDAPPSRNAGPCRPVLGPTRQHQERPHAWSHCTRPPSPRAAGARASCARRTA